ncbi:MAG: helix-turn-helix transcriptional regulator [Candidatus Gracilibacteria bacterium]
MLTFSELIKDIRNNIGLNQEEFAKLLGVSKIFIAQLETNTREPSKNFIKILSDKLKVSTFSIMPFLSNDKINDLSKLSKLEQQIYFYGVKLQNKLIKQNSKNLLINK